MSARRAKRIRLTPVPPRLESRVGRIRRGIRKALMSHRMSRLHNIRRQNHWFGDSNPCRLACNNRLTTRRTSSLPDDRLGSNTSPPWTAGSAAKRLPAGPGPSRFARTVDSRFRRYTSFEVGDYRSRSLSPLSVTRPNDIIENQARGVTGGSKCIDDRWFTST